MNEIKIELVQGYYRPLDVITGRVIWNLEKPPHAIAVEIGWFTEGRGSTDSHIEFDMQWITESTSGFENFSFQLPASPYSFCGTLIELIWYIQARPKKGNLQWRAQLVVAPHLQVVKL